VIHEPNSRPLSARGRGWLTTSLPQRGVSRAVLAIQDHLVALVSITLNRWRRFADLTSDQHFGTALPCERRTCFAGPTCTCRTALCRLAARTHAAHLIHLICDSPVTALIIFPGVDVSKGRRAKTDFSFALPRYPSASGRNHLSSTAVASTVRFVARFILDAVCSYLIDALSILRGASRPGRFCHQTRVVRKHQVSSRDGHI